MRMFLERVKIKLLLKAVVKPYFYYSTVYIIVKISTVFNNAVLFLTNAIM